MAAPSVTTLCIRGPSKQDANANVNAETGVMSAGGAQLTKGRFVIAVHGKTLTESGDESLTRLVRNVLSAYPIVDIVDDLGLPFDLQKWLRDHKKDL